MVDYLGEKFGRQRTHGLTGTPEFKAWVEAKQRCRAESPKRKWYAERGITFCDEWNDNFLAFLAHMGPRPKGTSLDRRNNNRGYEPGNCRWATKIEQMNNTSFNRHVMALGKTQTLSQWAAETGLKVGTIWKRLKDGATPEQAVTRKLFEGKRSCWPTRYANMTRSEGARRKQTQGG